MANEYASEHLKYAHQGNSPQAGPDNATPEHLEWREQQADRIRVPGGGVGPLAGGVAPGDVLADPNNPNAGVLSPPPSTPDEDKEAIKDQRAAYVKAQKAQQKALEAVAAGDDDAVTAGMTHADAVQAGAEHRAQVARDTGRAPSTPARKVGDK